MKVYSKKARAWVWMYLSTFQKGIYFHGRLTQEDEEKTLEKPFVHQQPKGIKENIFIHQQARFFVKAHKKL